MTVLVNSCEYQSLLDTGMAGVAVTVVVELGVAAAGEGAGTDAAVWCCLALCAAISLEPITLISHIALSIGMGSIGARLGGGWRTVVSGENMTSRSSTPLKPWGIWFRMSQCRGISGLPRSARKPSRLLSV